MAQLDEFEYLLSTEAPAPSVPPDPRAVRVVRTEMQSATGIAAALQEDPAMPAHLLPQLAALSAALQQALEHLAGRPSPW